MGRRGKGTRTSDERQPRSILLFEGVVESNLIFYSRLFFSICSHTRTSDEPLRPSLLFDPKALGVGMSSARSMFSPRTPGGAVGGGSEKKRQKKRKFMFQNTTSRLEWDEYGEAIDLKMCVRARTHAPPSFLPCLGFL
jgi:hypothetical protein